MSGLNATFSAANNNSGAAQAQGLSSGQFAASFITAIIVFSVQVGIFLLIKDRLARIYQPRTFLVPERERTKATGLGWIRWITPVVKTSNAEFVQKCGLDAYFFLRYLRTLLKIFVPAACVMIPILLPINAASGASETERSQSNTGNVTGLDKLAWGNVSPAHTGRYWAHWTLATLLIVHICYVVFDELKTYIRMRQAYMTSPQHRLRASATTVLVCSIPTKWCSVEVLEGLYDVFPGGVRNVWINRNYDELSDKVNKRDQLASALEIAETELIRKCFKKDQENIAKAAKLVGKKLTKEEKQRQNAILDAAGRQRARGKGLSSGNPHQVNHTLSEATGGEHTSLYSESDAESDDLRGDETDDLQQHQASDGIQAAKKGLTKVKSGLFSGARSVNKGFKNTLDTSKGFVGPDIGPQEKKKATSSPKAQRRSDADWLPTNREKDLNAPLTGSTVQDETDPEKGHATEEQAADGSGPLQTSISAGDGEEQAEQPQGWIEKVKQVIEQPRGWIEKVMQMVGLSSEPKEKVVYEPAFEPGFEQDPFDAVWRRYLGEKDRETMRLPIFGWDWMPSLPLIGEKVDTIRYCREQVARLNAEIEDDQRHPERFPLMNSAFVQFNHQLAAHMCCQAVSHHLPKQMAPRLVEIDPNDVVWDNMAIPWWQAYIRSVAVVSIVVCMVIVWAVPVAFTGALSQLSTAARSYPWLGWVMSIPAWVRSILQGVLPPALLGLLLWLLPQILRFLSKMQGLQSGTQIELSVQKYYLFFLFVQIFLIVTVASSAFEFVASLTSVDGLTSIPSMLGKSIPKASNYFISYMLLQAMSVSAGALLQVGSLIGWFILAPIFDSTARDKFKRQITLADVQWGTFFPVYTNLACIGIIYSVISPLILIFNVVSFSLFWFVYRYNTLFVTGFTRDTGGLLYPNAINSTYVGVYVMELTLVGMFFLVRDENGNVACVGQAIGMLLVLVFTIIYQLLLNHAFSPLFRYMPISLEDDAVRREEEFMRVLKYKDGLIDDKVARTAAEEQMEEYELREFDEEKAKSHSRTKSKETTEAPRVKYQNPEVMYSIEQESKSMQVMKKVAKKTADHTLARAATMKLPPVLDQISSSWADKTKRSSRRAAKFEKIDGQEQQRRSSDPFSDTSVHAADEGAGRKISARKMLDRLNSFNPVTGGEKDVEAQVRARNDLADALFSGLEADLEDMEPEQRDELVQRAFQHSALRARRPVIWLPRDELGVSDDEIKRMAAFSKKLWVSNVRQGLDSKGRCIYGGPPPDYSEVDLIRL
ncbi:hypothetical protein DV735_g4366, partial [Chaetothyriales sp. CBS 134920]